ncbi:Coq4 family protein [Flavobacterium enshiense]|uniref:Coq4 family protein n=1 Tax=Flavobacterium enshiense TaxID=1341165 RepID=UPI00345CAF5C
MKDKIIEKMYEISKIPYQKYVKTNKPWQVTKSELLAYPTDSLGQNLGKFLNDNNFNIQSKLEDHDIIHILTNTGITVEDEIAMQYYLLGNGKKSLYLFMVILSGTLFYSTQIREFIRQYKRGKKAHRFYDLNFEKLLFVPMANIRQTFNIQ